ncbi:MAG TPA: hypothetical protein VLI93_08945 [Acetobacteraceae bacterium]|nr:hypothetical protein [Acetobacteraceae bacterium]
MSEKMLIPDARHELRDVSGRFILYAFLLLAGSVTAVGLVVWGLFPRSTADKQITHTVEDFPTPQLQPDPRQDWQRFHRAEMQRLTTYGWIDKTHGVVHIPIDRAMQKIAKDGIPDWPASAAPQK